MKDLYENWASFLRFFGQHWKRIVLRAHKDKRSLWALLLLLGMVSYVVFYGYYLLKNPVSLAILCLAIFVSWRIRTSYKKDDELLISFSSYVPINAKPPQSAVMTLHVRTLRLWLLIWRASSESFLHKGHVPEGKEVLTRRVILDKLNELNLLDNLTESERDLHFLPDSAWPLDDIATTLIRRSELEALQYATGAVSSLVPNEDFNRIQTLSIDQIQTVTSDTIWQTQETFDIRNERDVAAAFYLRCLGEKVRRGTFKTNLDQSERELLEGAAERAGDEILTF